MKATRNKLGVLAPSPRRAATAIESLGFTGRETAAVPLQAGAAEK